MTEAIPAWAMKGARVVCIDASSGGKHFDPMPVKGAAYVIDGPGISIGPNAAVLIAGLPNRDSYFIDDYGWRITRFRPLVTRSQEQDVSHFVHHLNRVGVDA